MPRAVLVVNPAAGRVAFLARQLPAMLALLAARGFLARTLETVAAAGIAPEALEGSDLVFACGGDGTVHQVVQALAGGNATLGVIPLGTANALARNLGLPLDPLAALSRQLAFRPTRIPLGILEAPHKTCWFCVMAGCGPDGALVESLAAGSSLKRRFGRLGYYGQAGRLMLTRRWPSFGVRYRLALDAPWQEVRACGLMASRVRDLGGLFSGASREAWLTDTTLSVKILRAPAQLAFPAWMLGARGVLQTPWVRTVNAVEVRCEPLTPRLIYAQADGEPMGTLPFTLRLVPDALSLLMPA